MNPLHLLGLGPGVTDAEVKARAEVLDRSADDEQRVEIRAAVESLITNNPDRRRHELLDVPDAHYHSAEWERFGRRHARVPVDGTALAASSRPPEPGDFDLPAIIARLAAGLAAQEQPDLAAALRHGPPPGISGLQPIGVADVLFG